MTAELQKSQCITDCLKIHYNIEADTLELLPLGADPNASVYKVVAKDGSAYFVKQKHGVYNDIHLAVLELLHHAKIEEIIYPLQTIHGQLAQQAEDFSLIVYPFVEGQNGFSCSLNDEQWLKLGQVLRRIHQMSVPVLLQQKLRRELYSPKWRDQIKMLYREINAQSAADEMALSLLTFLKENRSLIQRLVDHAETLAQKLQAHPGEFVLCHSDIHAGNVLISENSAFYIVDWDEPIMAAKERDLMFFGGGVGNVWNQPREEEVFYKGYGQTKVNPEILAYYRCERIVEDIAIYTHELLSSKASSADRAEMYKHFMDQFEPNGVVEIALKTNA